MGIIDGSQKEKSDRWQTKEKIRIRDAGKKSRAPGRKRKLRKRRPKTLGAKVSSAYRTVVDTIKGTDATAQQDGAAVDFGD